MNSKLGKIKTHVGRRGYACRGQVVLRLHRQEKSRIKRAKILEPRSRSGWFGLLRLHARGRTHRSRGNGERSLCGRGIDGDICIDEDICIDGDVCQRRLGGFGLRTGCARGQHADESRKRCFNELRGVDWLAGLKSLAKPLYGRELLPAYAQRVEGINARPI